MNAEKFWSLMVKQPDGCWIWQGAHGRNGYGMASHGGSSHQTHRLAWRFTHGPIPHSDGYHGTVVGHKCDVRDCCNPDHLFLCSQKENVIDALKKGRFSGPRLVESQVVEILALIRDGISMRELVDKYKVSPSTIDSIAGGHTWKHLTKGISLSFAPREANPGNTRTADYTKISSMLESGMSARQIAIECGTSHPTVARVAKLLGIKPKKKLKVYPRLVSWWVTPTDAERIRDLRRFHISGREIAEHIGCSKASVWRVIGASP